MSKELRDSKSLKIEFSKILHKCTKIGSILSANQRGHLKPENFMLI